MLSTAYSRFMRSACSGPPARGEVARVAQAAGPQPRKSASSDEDDVGLIEAVLRVDVLAEREPRARARVVAAGRIPLCHLADGKRASRSRICAASVGELTDSVRIRRPAP